jgi:arabinogalactan oligomer/maltooligosaccharide transport system substrate-binding protein
MTKKTWSMITVLVIALLLLTACGGQADEGSDIETTISLWHSMKDSEIAAMTGTIIPAFQEKYPNVQVDLLFTPDNDLRGKFETAVSTGEGPDILVGHDDWGPAFYDALLAADVSDVLADYGESINAAAVAEGSYAGVQVGVPYSLKGVVMYRNTDIMPEAATDVADLLTKAAAANSGDVYGFVGETGPFFAMGHLHKTGDLMTPEGDPKFNSAAGVAWMEMLKSFDTVGPTSQDDDNDVNLFKQGKAGVIIDGAWNIGAFTDLGDVVVIDPWPEGMSGFVQSSYIFLNANVTGDQATAAKAFMGFLLTTEAQAAFYEADPAFIPANSQVEVTDPLRQQAMAAFDGGVGFVTIPEMGAYWGPVGNAILAVRVDNADIQATLDSAFQAVTDSVAEIRAGQ